jgi:trans-aconitate methyltransferase
MKVGDRIRAVLEERLALMAPARRLRLALSEEVVDAHAGGRPLDVLDAGCGDGLLTLALAKRHPGWTLLGVDRRDDMLEGARGRARARSLGNVTFTAGDLERPLPASGLDAVLAIECLSEIPDDALALRSMVAALAPGGLLVAQVPERGWRPVLPGSPKTWREQVRQGYDAEQIAAALRGAGLERVEVRPTFGVTVAVAQEVRDLIKDRGLAVRLAAFPLLAGAVRLERWGVTGGRSNALLASGRRPTI